MKIYLATPYRGKTGNSFDDSFIENERYDQITKIAGELTKMGFMVFSPITHSHPMAVRCSGIGDDFDYWEKFDLSMVKWADVLIVTELKGWTESRGLACEIEYAKKIGRMILHLAWSDCRTLLERE